MRRADGQRKQTTEHSKVKPLQDTLQFDNAPDMQVAIRYRLNYAYVWKYLFHPKPW